MDLNPFDLHTRMISLPIGSRVYRGLWQFIQISINKLHLSYFVRVGPISSSLMEITWPFATNDYSFPKKCSPFFIPKKWKNKKRQTWGTFVMIEYLLICISHNNTFFFLSLLKLAYSAFALHKNKNACSVSMCDYGKAAQIN